MYKLGHSSIQPYSEPQSPMQISPKKIVLIFAQVTMEIPPTTATQVTHAMAQSEMNTLKNGWPLIVDINQTDTMVTIPTVPGGIQHLKSNSKHCGKKASDMRCYTGSDAKNQCGNTNTNTDSMDNIDGPVGEVKYYSSYFHHPCTNNCHYFIVVVLFDWLIGIRYTVRINITLYYSSTTMGNVTNT